MPNEDPTEKLMRRITDGLIGWLTYQRASKMFPRMEQLLYPPIQQIAMGRGWRVLPQFRRPGLKASTIDFAFFLAGSRRHHRMTKAALLEVKLVSDLTGKTHSIQNDLNKLLSVRSKRLVLSDSFNKLIFDDDFELDHDISLQRFMLIAGEKLNVRKRLEEEGQPFSKDALALWSKAFTQRGKVKNRGKESTDAGRLRHSPAFLNYDHMLLLLRETKRWSPP